MIFEKKGEITSFHLVALIIAIVGFAVVLILLFSLEFESFSGEEVCRLSVLSRATTPLSVQGYVPLQCTTKKVCITDNTSGKCEQFAGEKGVVKVTLPNDEVEAAEVIERKSVEAMYKCWKMMGEGKLDLFAEPIEINMWGNVEGFLNLDRGGPTCVICTRVALDKDLVYKKDSDGKFTKDITERFQKISNYIDVNGYISAEGPKDSKKTYLRLFTNDQIGELEKEFTDEGSKKVGTDQIGIMFMQIKSAEDPATAAGKGAVAVVGVILGGSFALGTTGSLAKMAVSHPIVALVGLVAGVGGTAGLKAYGAYQEQLLSASYCKEFSGKESEKNKLGCSVVAPVDYNNIAEVNKLCWKIEGNP